MMRSEDLAPLLAAQPAAGVGFRKGTVVTWDPLTAANTIDIDGAVFTNLPTIASSTEVLLMKPGDVVGIQVVGNGATSTMYVIGRITLPGTPQAASVMSMFGLQAAKVATLETTPSTTYTNLTTVGPQLTAQIGPTGRCLVILTADISVASGLATSGTAEGYMSFDISNPPPGFPFALDDWSLSARLVWITGGGATITLTEETQKSRVVLVTGLSAGPHTFTAKYRAAFGTVDFSRRELVVLPF